MGAGDERRDSSRDLILSTAQGYGWENVRTFLESLHATGYDGDVTFFMSRPTEETVARLAAAGVEVSRPKRLRVGFRGHVFQPYRPKTTRIRWHVQPLYRHVVRALAALAPDRRVASMQLTGAISNIDVARHYWYYGYLSRVLPRYRNVMLTDVRDVVFLGTPFDFEIGDDVHFFLEHDRYRIGDQVNNRGWIAGAYGEDALRELADRPISCAGVTIGAARAVLGYLSVTTEHLSRLARQFHGMDQGIHNYVIHNGLVPRARFHGNHDGPVLTLGLMTDDEATALVAERGAEAKVVHQYDRHPSLVRMFAGGDFQVTAAR